MKKVFTPFYFEALYTWDCHSKGQLMKSKVAFT